MKTGAHFSECRVWRYGLWRTWDESLPVIAFIGLNPSTADETKDDPTIRRCIGFAKSWGYGCYLMLNLFAYRATDPREMKTTFIDPIGPESNDTIVNVVRSCPMTIAAWGVHGEFKNRDIDVKAMLRKEGLLDRLHHLGLTKHGHPKHPLYLKADLKPIPFA